jgi:3-isopropylmalate/(R)-2-methylmalate dehydratase small subunit
MEPFRIVTGAAAPLPLDDVNTDQVIPSAYLKALDADMAEGFLAYMRRDPAGQRNAQFVLEREPFQHAPILLTGTNFGCGSSREHAVWAMRAWGVRCVVGASPAEFFRDNCLKNGVLPVTLAPDAMAALLDLAIRIDGREPFTADLERCEIRGPGGYVQPFAITPGEREALLEGLDDIGLTLRQLDAIQAWEQRTAKVRPFLQQRMPGASGHPL